MYRNQRYQGPKSTANLCAMAQLQGLLWLVGSYFYTPADLARHLVLILLNLVLQKRIMFLLHGRA
jgi:hypothetical protein